MENKKKKCVWKSGREYEYEYMSAWRSVCEREGGVMSAFFSLFFFFRFVGSLGLF
jgi:hypothetical protein